MRKFCYTLLIMVLISGFSFAQTYDLQFIEETNDGFVGGNFDARIQIQSVGGTFDLGTSNLVFSFNTTGLANPTLLTAHNFDGLVSLSPVILYASMVITQPFADVVSVNIVLSSVDGDTVEAAFMDVATIRFEILDTGETSNLVWRTASPNPTAVFDDNAVGISSNNLNGLDVSLPVELTSFTANVSEDLDVNLKWVTATEVNNQGFEVFRSTEEEGTYDILSSYTGNNALVGQGNSSSPHTYTFSDKTVLQGNTYWYKITDVDFNGVRTYHGPISILVKSGNTAGGEDPTNIPDEFAISQNYPNPFNPQTRISVAIPNDEGIGEITVNIYDIMGKKVTTLFKGNLEPGIHTLEWNGLDASGKQVSGGTYFYYFKSNKFHQIKKMIFMK